MNRFTGISSMRQSRAGTRERIRSDEAPATPAHLSDKCGMLAIFIPADCIGLQLELAVSLTPIAGMLAVIGITHALAPALMDPALQVYLFFVGLGGSIGLPIARFVRERARRQAQRQDRGRYDFRSRDRDVNPWWMSGHRWEKRP